MSNSIVHETTRCFTKRTEITFPRTTECTQRSIIFHARSVNPGRIEENYVRCSRTEHKWKSCTVRPTGRLKGLAVIQINERGSRRGSVRPSACDPYDFSFPQVTNLSCPLPPSLSLSLSPVRILENGGPRKKGEVLHVSSVHAGSTGEVCNQPNQT